MPFLWPLLGEALCSQDNHALSHLISACDYVWCAGCATVQIYF